MTDLTTMPVLTDVSVPARFRKDRWLAHPEEELKKMALRRMVEYRVDALDAIHDLATMEITDNSAMAQVKLAAAKVLAFPEGAEKAPAEGGIMGTLRSLNEAYHKDAPRIRTIRERVVTFETTEPRVIEQATGE